MLANRVLLINGFLITCLLTTSCSPTEKKLSTSYRTVINGVIKHTATQKINGAELKLEASAVKFMQGKPVEWSAESVIKLSEQQVDGNKKSAEFRPDGKEFKLFMEKAGKFEAANTDDEKWAGRILSIFNFNDIPESEKAQYYLPTAKR